MHCAHTDTTTCVLVCTRRNRPKLVMNNVTLVLPQNDYMVLLSAALRAAAATPAEKTTPTTIGDSDFTTASITDETPDAAPGNSAGTPATDPMPAWKVGANLTAPVLAGITLLELESDTKQPGAAISPSMPFFVLKNYTGWNVTGVDLVIMPEQPLEPCQPLPDWPTLAPECYWGHMGPSSSGETDDREQVKLGVGVGVGVGCGVLLLLAGTGILLHVGRLKR